jgi:hypothetical protein
MPGIMPGSFRYTTPPTFIHLKLLPSYKSDQKPGLIIVTIHTPRFVSVTNKTTGKQLSGNWDLGGMFSS